MNGPIAVDLETTSTNPLYGSVLSCAVSDGVSTHAWMVRSPSDLDAVRDVLRGSKDIEPAGRRPNRSALNASDRWVEGTPPGLDQLSDGYEKTPNTRVDLGLGLQGKSGGGSPAVSLPPTDEPIIVHWVPMEGSWSELFLGNPRHENFRDTALMAYRVSPGEPMRLASVTARELPEYSGWKGSTEEQLAAPETGRSMLGVSEKDLLERNAVDACLTRRVHDKLWPKLTQEERDLHPEDVAISLFVNRMSMRGMHVSEERLIELRTTCLGVMEQEQSWLRQRTGDQDLNPGSTKQLAKVLGSRNIPVYTHRGWQDQAVQGVACLPQTDTGEVSTSGLALRLLRANTSDTNTKELIDHVLSYRKAQDRLGDNVTAYTQARDPGDGRIRGGYFWPGTVSWRPTCFAPNRLNVPRDGVRQLFTAPRGFTFLEADLSQAELRIMAQLSQDPVLLSGYREKRDFHRDMGRDIYRRQEITDAERYVGKKTNFSCGYFIGDWTLWESFAKEDVILPFSTVQAGRYAYWRKYQGLKRYADEQRNKVKNGEYLYAPTGGYRWNLEQARLIHPRDENEAVNSVYNWTIQSVPPRLMYRICLLLEKRIPETCCQIVNSIYDSLMAYVREDCVQDVVREIQLARSEVMAAESRWLRDVDIPCDISVGASWSKKELKGVTNV